MNLDYFTQLQESLQKNSLLVEKVKLGDVMFAIESQKLTIEQLIRTNEEWIVQTTNEELQQVAQAKIEAYKQALDCFEHLYSNIKKLSI